MTNKELIKEVQNIVKPLADRIEAIEEVFSEEETEQDNVILKCLCKHQQGKDYNQQTFFDELKAIMIKHKVVNVDGRLEIKL